MPKAKTWNIDILLKKTATELLCTAVHGLWTVEKLAELTDEPTVCGEMARGGCLFVRNFSVTRSSLLTEADT